MQKHKEDFKTDSCICCTDAFAIMGDGTEVPVAGCGVSRMKVDGKTMRLPGSLHIPNLDCDPFSSTRHGRLEDGHSFVLSGGKAHSTHPGFTITRDIPNDCDMKVRLETLSNEDWELPNCLCDGGGESDCNCNSFEERLAFINRVFDARHSGRHMTRSQRHKMSNKVKSALGTHDEDTDATDLANKKTPGADHMNECIFPNGTEVIKHWNGHPCNGTVIQCDPTERWCQICFEDNDTKDWTQDELPQHIDKDAPTQAELVKHIASWKTPDTSGNVPTNLLDDQHHHEGSINESLLAKLKELNIHDVKQIISKCKFSTIESAEKCECAPPP